MNVNDNIFSLYLFLACKVTTFNIDHYNTLHLLPIFKLLQCNGHEKRHTRDNKRQQEYFK